MNKKLLSINLLSSFVAFAISTGINFVLSPFIIENLGSESYAFVKLANDFIGYISLISIAINSMAGRFISISFLKGDIKESNLYYTSVFYADLILSAIIFILGLFVIIYLEGLINIPKELIFDVKLVFFLVLVNAIISIYFTVYSVGIFIKNKLYLTNIRSVESGIFRIIFLFLLFFIFKPHIYYIPLATLIVTLYTGLYNMYYTKKLVPELVINRRNFQVKYIKDVIFSGIWNIVSQLSFILNEGLDLLISNIFVGAAQMGILAVAKTLPNLITSIYSNISSVFSPDLTRLYANKKFNEMKMEIDLSIKVLGIIVNIPVAGLIIFGKEFYNLWIPTQDINNIYILSILTIMCVILSGSTVSIHSIFTIANKVKINSIVTLFVGVINFLLVLLLLKTTNLGVFAIAGVSSSTSIIRNLVFTFPYAAKCIKCKWTAFYFPAFRGVFCCLIVCIIDLIVKYMVPVSGWLTFFVAVIIGSCLGILANVFIVLNKKERMFLLRKLKK